MSIKKYYLKLLLFIILLSIYFFIPVDFIWFILLTLIIGFIEAIIFLSKREKRKLGIFVLLSNFLYLIIYLIFLKFTYNYYHLAWNVVYFIMTFTIIVIPWHFLFFNKHSKKKKNSILIFIIVSIGLKSFLFDTKYYYTATHSILIQDVRYFKKEGYYKVIGNHKLLRKNPAFITTEDVDSIMFFLNKTNWLEENYSNSLKKEKLLLDEEYIKNNLRYVCSTIGLYNIIKADIFCLKIPLNKSNFIKLYIPKGTFSLYDESDINKYYNKELYLINNCYYEGVLLPPLTEKQFLEWTK